MIGQTVSHYRILGPVGGGGMGVVYEAEDTRLERRVALKFLSKELAQDPAALARFRREARAIAALNHPNICTIHEIDEHEGLPFIVMELMKGETLRQRIGRGPLKTDEIVDSAGQFASALEAAHAQGILHRDIKPANIFLTGRGQAKILDFGLAKQVSPKKRAGDLPASEMPTVSIDHLTEAGTTLGTIAYMSPEQTRGEELDVRSDLFALGAVIYEMTTGRNAFDGETSAVIFNGILSRDPVSPSEINPETPAKLSEMVLKLMEKDRTLRYQSASELEADLKRFRRDSMVGRSAVRASAGQLAVAEPSPPVPAALITATQSPTKGLARRIAVLLAVLVVGAIAVLAARSLWQRPAPRVEPAVASTAAPSASGSVAASPVEVPPAKNAAVSKSEPLAASQPKEVKTLAPAAKSKPAAAPVTTSNGIEFVRIPAGEYVMGSTYGNKREQPVHLVKITQSFEMGKYEVTQAQWEAVLGYNRSQHKGATSLPVDSVSWNDAQAFILALNTRKDGYTYRLPTEAEWEYACRAGTTQEYAGNPEDLGWYDVNSGMEPHPVGQKKPNAWGLYDMHGNVWEWVQDFFAEDYYAQSAATDPQGPSAGVNRAERGGAWRGMVWSVRSSNRNGILPDSRGDAIGFRLVRTAK